MSTAASAGTTRRLVRRLVLATSVPPMLQAYRGAYRVATRWAVRLFRKYPAIRAVYLTRGSAKGEVLPLVSDIDFLLIHEGLTSADRAELTRAYGRLARVTHLFDAHLRIVDEATLRRDVRVNDHFRYRFTEGKATWKLLYGRDYVGELPTPDTDTLDAGLLAEIKVWWSLFGWRFLETRKYSTETVTRNNVCYKAVAEVLKAIRRLSGDALSFDRAGALEAAKPSLDSVGQALVGRLQAHRRRGFRVDDPTIVEDTTAFLLARLDRFYAEAENHPVAGDSTSPPVTFDAPLVEEPCAEVLQAARELTEAIRQLWGPAFKGAHLVASVHFNVAELLLLIVGDTAQPPSLELLRAAVREHQARSPALRRRLRIFLRLANAAFQLDAQDIEQSWQSILWSPANPDAFALMAASDRCLEGAPIEPASQARWGPLVSRFLIEEEMLFGELLQDRAVYKLNSLDFLRVFWKVAQLVVINRSAARGAVVVPLTVPAIRRALAREGIELSPALASLHAAYDAVVGGTEPEIAELIPGAIAYLKEIRA